MPSVGVPELLVIFMILLLVFGGSRLPQIGEGMGKAIRGFKRGMASDDSIEVRDKTKRDEPSDADVIDKG